MQVVQLFHYIPATEQLNLSYWHLSFEAWNQAHAHCKWLTSPA